MAAMTLESVQGKGWLLCDFGWLHMVVVEGSTTNCQPKRVRKRNTVCIDYIH